MTAFIAVFAVFVVAIGTVSVLAVRWAVSRDRVERARRAAGGGITPGAEASGTGTTGTDASGTSSTGPGTPVAAPGHRSGRARGRR